MYIEETNSSRRISLRRTRLISAVLLSVTFGVILLLACTAPRDDDGEDDNSGTASGKATPGLYPDGAADPVTSIITLDQALSWLAANAKENSRYAIYLQANEKSAPRILEPGSLNGAKGVEVTLFGHGSERMISLSENGSLFTVQSSDTKLILGKNVTLLGRNTNTAALVTVNAGGVLEMQAGAKVINNTNINTSTAPGANQAGGIYVYRDASFLMTGGEISGNNGTYGGGVWMNAAQNFSMTGGTIQNNTAQTAGGGLAFQDELGSGVISGGSIINNTAHNGSTEGTGGGIAIMIDGTLAISGSAVISGNKALGTADFGGGGICIAEGTLQFSGGTLANNTTAAAHQDSAGSHNLKVRPKAFFINSSGAAISGSVPPY